MQSKLKEAIRECVPPIVIKVFRRIIRKTTPQPLVSELKQYGTFTDDKGVEHELLEGFRDTCVPRWPGFFKERNAEIDPNSVNIARRKVARDLSVLAAHGVAIQGARILEIGCGDGGYSMALAEQGADSVLATDIVDYWAREVRGDSRHTRAKERQAMRQMNLRAMFPASIQDKVEFGFLDISKSPTTEEPFDLVVSHETLEHVPAMGASMTNMFQSLRPGGIAFHVYNPFFCFTGGHSLCTLDFPFAHVLLSSDDFRRYVHTYRSDETDLAISFFEKSLNRTTIRQMQKDALGAGFTLLTVMENLNEGVLKWVTSKTLQLAQENYPDLELNDLLAETVTIVLRKPESDHAIR